MLAQPVGRPKTAVRNAWRAAPERLALGVQIACPVNIVQAATKMLLRVLIAPLVLVKVMQGKHRAFHAVPVNTTMLPVRFAAKNVSIQRTMVAKKETAAASSAQSVGRPKTAVQNVLCAKRVKRALAAMAHVTTARPVGFVQVA